MIRVISPRSPNVVRIVRLLEERQTPMKREDVAAEVRLSFDYTKTLLAVARKAGQVILTGGPGTTQWAHVSISEQAHAARARATKDRQNAAKRARRAAAREAAKRALTPPPLPPNSVFALAASFR